MNALIETLNRFGEEALHFAWPMLWQSSVLIVVLLVADFVLHRHVRAAVRYTLWLVLLVKLLLPPSLALPTGVAWWLLPAARPANPHTTRFVVSYDTDAALSLPPQPIPVFTPSRPAISAAAWIVLAWSTISVGLLGWLTVRWRQVAGDVKHTVPGPVWLDELFREAKTSAGLRRNVRLRVTVRAMSPAVCGLFRPVILLPQSLVQKLPPAQLRAVLLHELTHLRRGDVWLNCTQALVQIVYWWHPLLWLANARIRRVREEAVDDVVMLILREDAEIYAPTLIEVAKLAFQRPLTSLGLVGILESRSALRQRIERLVNFCAPRTAGLTFLSVLGILAFSALAVPMGEAPARTGEPAVPSRPADADTSQSGNAPNPAGVEQSATNVYTRTFMVTPNPGLANLRKKTGLTESSTSDEYLRGFAILLSASGTRLPVTSLWFEKNGQLVVHGTRQELDVVEQMVLELNGFPARQSREVASSRTIIDEASPMTGQTGASTGFVLSSPDRKIIFNKLMRTRLNAVSFPEGLPLSEVLHILSIQSKLRDPDKKGISFLFNSNAPAASLPSSAAAATEVLDPSSINVKLMLTNVTFAEVLEAIVLVADHPIQYSILDDGIVFSTKGSNSAPLETRTFKVNTNIFLANFQKQTGLKNNVSAAVHQFVLNVGVDLSAPKTIYFNETRGVLFIRATKQDLDTVEKAVQVLNYTSPPQIHIKARFIETQERMVKAPGVNFIPAGATNIASALTDPDLRLVIHDLEQRDGFENLAEPEVTVASGRKVQMRATTIFTVITNFAFQDVSTNSALAPQTTQVEFGPVLDVVASVLSDGYTIDLKMTASVTDFLGYDKTTNTTLVVNRAGLEVSVPTVLPSLRARQADAHLRLWDGQTVVLDNWISPQNQPMKVLGVPSQMGRFFRSQSKPPAKKNLMVFVTATIVDSAGNRVHNDDELPFAGNSVPAQDTP